ncbi:hypothetical protein I4U23_026382 [Adineta vaga]|nr:hypothetical protein I4U23_026382 [Adineta vaga]
MNENKEGEVSVLNDPDGVEDGKLQIEAINKALDELYAQLTQSKLESSKIFEKLLRKFDQLQANETDPRTRCRQSILLCGELVDGITEATDTDVNDFRGCLRLLYRLISDFESSARIENNNLFAREIFFALLDILTGTKICSYLNENPRVKISNKEFYRMLTDVLLTIAASTVRNTLFTSADISTRKYTEIFQIMYKRVNRDLDLIAKTDNRLSDDSQTTSCILSFFWSFSNHTVIVPWLLNIGLIEVMLKCLQITKISQTICQLINIIHNISRHDDGTDELNQFNGLQILKDVQNNTTQKLDDFNNLVISMVIAQLSTVEQIRSDNKRMNRILNQLLQMTIDASKTENHLNEKGFHVSEFLAVFTRLFVDDRSLEYVLNHAETDPQLKVSTTIGLFVDLLIDFQNIIRTKDHLKEFTCTALVNILWSISFHDRYKTKLKQNDKLLKTLRNLDTDKSAKTIDQYVPRSMESINKAASGILYNLNDILDEKKSIDPGVQLVANTNNEKPMIMISYAHDNDSFCDKILEILEKKHNLYRIWIDRNHCSSSDDLWEKISRGIGQSRLVVCLLSEEYFNSKSCRKEAALAVKRKKPIVPIYLGNPGDCDWLGLLFYFLDTLCILMNI